MPEEEAKMTEEKSQGRKFEVPTEVLRIIGPQHHIKKQSIVSYSIALRTLKALYKQHGLDWIRENKELLRRGLEDLEGF